MDRIEAMRAFVRVAEVGSFTAVARELRVKQSTISKWIATLEEELGTQLVERTTRAQHVTEAGERFYQRAREIVASYEQLSAELQAGAPVPRGRLRASVPVVFGRLFVIPLLASFCRAHPEIELDLTFSDRYVHLVEEGIDVAIRVGVPADSTFRVRTLGETRRHLVASPRYLEAHPAIRAPSDLGDHACLLHTELRTGDVWSFERDRKVVRVPVRGRLATNHSEALLAMAREGLGVALLAEWLVAPDLKAKRLKSLLPRHRAARAPIQAVTPPGRHPHARVRAFVDHLAAAWRQVPALRARS